MYFMKNLIVRCAKHSMAKFYAWTSLGKGVELVFLLVLTSVGVPRVVAYVPSFIASMLWNFFGSYHIVFAKTGRKIGESFAMYMLVALGGLALNQFVLALLEFELGWYNWGVIVAGPPVVVWSYVWNRQLTFGEITKTKRILFGLSMVAVIALGWWATVTYYQMEMGI